MSEKVASFTIHLCFPRRSSEYQRETSPLRLTTKQNRALYRGDSAVSNISVKRRTDYNKGRTRLHDSQLKMIEIT